MDKDSSYKKTLKSTAVFGGAQAIQMLITILRAKLIAVIFGSHGMGINAIFQSTISIISSFSSFGIFQSAVRDISQEFENGDEKKLSRIKLIFNRMVWATGGFGLLVCLCGAFWLSKIAFQSFDYSMHFLILSLGIFFSALSNGQTVFLQGTRNLTALAKASLGGTVLGLLISIPLFYYCGILGIAAAITSSSLILYLTQYYFSRKIKLDKTVSLTVKETIAAGKPILKLGAILMFGMVILTGFTYLTNIFIGRYGKIADVGFFQGISSITTQSIAIVIAVLASDFFPRLSAVFLDKQKVKLIINEQAELVSLIIAPISAILIIGAPIIVKVLLSKEFLVMVPMLRLLALSLLSKGIWLIMSYVILANGDKKAYLIYDSLIGNGLLFLSNIFAYSIWGLHGLAMSYLIASISVCIILTIVVKIKYGVSLSYDFLKLIIFLSLLVTMSYFMMYISTNWLRILMSVIVAFVIFTYSLYILNKRIGFVSSLRSKYNN